MTEITIDSGIRTKADLLAILPPEVAERIEMGDREVLADSAGALRILATIKNPGWRGFVELYRIDWAGMLAWARQEQPPSGNVRVRVEAAASLDGSSAARPELRYIARALDAENLLAVLDAIRIVADGGLTP